MDSQTTRAGASARFLGLPTTLLFSILTFTSMTSAQSSFSSISATPTNFQTSVSSASSASFPSSTPPSSSSTPPSTSSPTSNPPENNNNDPDSTNDRVQRSVFNYYFLIIAAALIVLGAGVLYLRSRRRRKAASYRSTSQRALARDVEGFRSRFNFGGGSGAFGIGGAAYRSSTRTRPRGDAEEGLDERGEAPPPYVEGTKPPSITETHRGGLPEGEAVELHNMERNVTPLPPSYGEHSSDRQAGVPTITISSPENLTADADTSPAETRLHTNREVGVQPESTELTRPPAAVTASERIT